MGQAKKIVRGNPKKRNLKKEEGRDIFSAHLGGKLTKGIIKNKKRKSKDDDANRLEDKLAKVSECSTLSKQRLFSVNNVKRESRVSYESMVEGTVVCCRINSVTCEKVSVSLPYRMIGYIPLNYISLQYTALLDKTRDGEDTGEIYPLDQLYKPGQWILASVVSSQFRKHKDANGLQMSLQPSDVNGATVNAAAVRAGHVIQCSVASVEDNGWVLDTGVRGVSAAFLPADKLDAGHELQVGSTVQCVVTLVGGKPSSPTLTMSGRGEDVRPALMAVREGGEGITPGSMLQGIVSATSANGLKLHLGSEDEYFDLMEDPDTHLDWKVGLVDHMHLRSVFDQSHLFRPGKKLEARVLFVSNFPKTVYLTLNKKVMQLEAEPFPASVCMHVATSCIVTHVSDHGVTVKINDQAAGFCFLHKAAGTQKITVTALKEKYPIGKELQCLPIAYNSADNVFIVLFDVKDHQQMNQELDDFKAGQKMELEIVDYTDRGAKVKTQSGIRGFVKNIHLTDTNMANPKSKHPVGSKVQAKILCLTENSNKMSAKKFVHFTLKSHILKSDLPLIAEYNEELLGTQTNALIQSIHATTMFLELTPYVQAIVYGSDIGQKVLSSVYEVGQVIEVTLTSLTTALKTEKPLYVAKTVSVIVKPTVSAWFSELKGIVSPKKDQGNVSDLNEIDNPSTKLSDKPKDSNILQKNSMEKRKKSSERENISGNINKKSLKKRKMTT